MFHGKVFTLMQSLNESERAEVEALILQGGGTLSGVAAVAHFVVCPLVRRSVAVHPHCMLHLTRASAP